MRVKSGSIEVVTFAFRPEDIVIVSFSRSDKPLETVI